MKAPKITLSNGCLAFLCGYCVFDPRRTFLPFLISVAAHETGHLLALRCMKIPVFGIHCSLEGMEILTPPLTYRQEILGGVAGPVVNLLLFLLTEETYPIMALINGILLLYNLLPIYPLDGGRILRGLLYSHLPLDIGMMIEKICAILCMLSFLGGSLYLSFAYKCGLWPILFCAFLLYRLGETILIKRKKPIDKIQFT